MKLLKKSIDQYACGFVSLRPQDPEDLWHVYHLVAIGDQLTSKTFRRIQKETAGGTSNESERVKITVTIQVEKVDFDPGAETMRVAGPCIAENVHIKMGSYHTLDLTLNKNFTVAKHVWDSIALERVEDATNPDRHADAAAVIMNEGVASVCLISGGMTHVKAKIESSIPRKHKAAVAAHEKAVQKFYENVVNAIVRHVNFEVVKVVIIASPGFIKDQFMEFLLAEAQRKEIKVLMENKNKLMLVHTSSGHLHALKEVLASEGVASKLADTKAAGEVRALNNFYEMLKSDPARAFYGWQHVSLAHERLAVATLLLVDDLFRAANIATRNKYVSLVDSVKENGGIVHIFSSLHPSGEQLLQLGGIAAILRFPLPELEELEEEEQQEQ